MKVRKRAMPAEIAWSLHRMRQLVCLSCRVFEGIQAQPAAASGGGTEGQGSQAAGPAKGKGSPRAQQGQLACLEEWRPCS